MKRNREYKLVYKHALLIIKSTFCQKVKVLLKDQKIHFISNLKKPACASKQDVLELSTLKLVRIMIMKKIGTFRIGY